jgi:hypothetical protein
MGYLSKQLDTISQGWPPCLHVLAATAALVTEADKLTLQQQLTVHPDTNGIYWKLLAD